MVSMAILVSITLGVMSSINYYQTRMVHSNAQISLEKIRGDILDRLQNDRSWRETVIGTPSLQCVEDMANCDGVGNNFAVDIYNDDATLYIDANTRFTAHGAPCDPADIAALAADPAGLALRCPITFAVTGDLNCPGGVPCYPTSVNLTVIPFISNEFSRMYGAINAGDPNNPVPTCKFCLTFNRGLSTRQQTFSYSEVNAGPGGPGACGANVWTARDLNTLVDDQEAVAALDGGGGLNLPVGRYKCRAEATAFNVGAFRIAPFVDGAQLGTISGAGFTSVNAGSKAFVEFEIRQNAAFNLTIQQMCARTVSACDLGLTAGCGVGTYARIDCTRVF